MIDAAADEVVRRAVGGVDKDFLTRPFEWERLALLARVSRVQDPELASGLRTFLEECVPAALLRSGTPPPDGARRNPVAGDSGLKYEGLVDASGRSCESVRRRLNDALRAEVESHDIHRDTLAALAAYGGGADGDMKAAYVDKLVRNHWFRPEATEGELAAATRSVGTYRWLDVDKKTTRVPIDGGRHINSIVDLLMLPATIVAEFLTSAYAETSQWISESTEAKQRYYLITTHAPHLYGLSLMLLMALFPVASLYALLPGKWTALLHFCKVFVSIKLWPFGWALLTAFTQRRPSALALADAHSDLRANVEHALRTGEVPNLFITITLMYFLVPALSFLVIQLVSHAASLPFQSVLPRPAGGSAAGAAGQAAAVLAEKRTRVRRSSLNPRDGRCDNRPPHAHRLEASAVVLAACLPLPTELRTELWHLQSEDAAERAGAFGRLVRDPSNIAPALMTGVSEGYARGFPVAAVLVARGEGAAVPLEVKVLHLALFEWPAAPETAILEPVVRHALERDLARSGRPALRLLARALNETWSRRPGARPVTNHDRPRRPPGRAASRAAAESSRLTGSAEPLRVRFAERPAHLGMQDAPLAEAGYRRISPERPGRECLGRPDGPVAPGGAARGNSSAEPRIPRSG
jgi:hypothetical protein